MGVLPKAPEGRHVYRNHCNQLLRKRQSTAALQNLAEFLKTFEQRGSVMECGCALPLSIASAKLDLDRIALALARTRMLDGRGNHNSFAF